MTALVTGAAGAVGSALVPQLRKLGAVVATDIDVMDVTDSGAVRRMLRRTSPTTIYHLAGAKHAPAGEVDPEHVARVNILGTANVLEHAGHARVVFSSTCKACDPETAYGASKLIAERMVLNAGGVVVRYFNIPEAGGNVFRIWEAIPFPDPLPVTDCWRYFVSMGEAVELTVRAASLPSGRYAPDPGNAQYIPSLAGRLYPNRAQIHIPRRRGDRPREPLHAACETVERLGSFLQIVGAHDPVREPLAVAA